MPINRYQIRNEYSLADPELYRAADKDDPEALLEGVAMAGLVGVLRQLGDLAEFAAEVFHDLHEEVIATAARGHSLKGRVQQLEADFPSIEKAFLSQTNHSSFFYNGGIDWHPNMRMDQNLITRGDLPRFIMDSYEECRGPPRLFLLDKFDVAGAGACLKRYTDPSFFKVEGSALGITDADVQREKRTRKGKKRGSRWSNGETPEVLQTSHAKLHQLLLEERIENNISDPARRVKLKRRLNGFPFDLKTGGSYMEKFLKIPSPEQKVVHEISVSSSPLRLPSNSTYESGLDIRSESPDKKFRHGSLSPPPDMEGTLRNHSMDKLNGVNLDNGIYELPKANHSFEGDNILSIFHEEVGEKEIAIDGESKTECSIDDYQSDGVASQVDDYVDALATMESEMDTDSELRAKSDLHVLSNKRRMSGYDGTEAEHQAPSSDTQSMGSSMLSDDGNSSSKKQISSSSYSDSRSISAENIPLEGVVSDKGLLNKSREDKGTAGPLKQECVNEDIGLVPSAEHANDDGGTKVAEIPVYRSDHSEQTMPNLAIAPPTLAQVDADSTMRDHVMVEGETEEIMSAHNAPETELINDTGSETNLIVSILGDSKKSDAPLKSENDTSPRVSAENWAVTGLDDKYPNRDDSFPSGLSEIPWHSRDASSVADSSKSQHLEDLKTEENHSSLSPTYQPLDELGDDNLNLTEDPPESSLEDMPVNRLDSEDPISISGASDDDLNVLTDTSANLPNTINNAQEDEKTNNSLGSIYRTENAEDDMENEADNQIDLPISEFPHAEEESPKWSLPELETHDTVIASDHIFSTPDDVIFPAVEEQSLELSLLELDSHDTSMESDQIVLVPDDVILPATEEQSLERSSPELESHDTATESDHIVSVPDDVTPPAAETVAVVSSPKDSTIDVHSKDLQIPGITDDIHPLDPAENQLDTPTPVISHLEEIHFERSVIKSSKDVHSNDLHTSGIPDGIQPPDPAIKSIEDQIDSPIPVISHLEEIHFERSVMDSSTDVHSNDLHTSGIPDGIQPPDPAIKSIEDQIDSPIPVISHLDEQSLDLTRSKFETHGKGAEPDDIISDLNNVIPPAGEIAVDTKPTIESPSICDLKKLQASVNIDDVPQLDSAEVGISYNGEQILHELPSSEEGEKTDEVILSTDLVERDAANFMISADHKSLTRNVDVNDANAEKDDADTALSAGFDDNAKDCGVTLSDLKKLDEESLSNFEESNQNQMEAEVSVQDIYTKSNVLTELGIPKVASPALASGLSDTLHHDHTEPEVLGNVPDSCSQVESSLDLGNAATTSSPLQQSGLGTNALTSQESNPSDYCEDISLLHIHHDAEEHKVKPSPDQLDKVETRILQNTAQASLESLPQLGQKGSLDHFDLDGCYNTASGSLLVNLSSQPSVSKLLPPTNCSIGDIGRPKDPFSSSTAFGLLPEAKINLEDMPPLPPLPPVQWRMGKQQHASLVQEKEALPSNVSAFPSFSMSITDQKAQPLNPFLPRYDMAGENTHLVDGYTSHQVPPTVHHESNTNSLPPLGETRSVNQLLPSPEKFDEMLQNDSRVGEKDIPQPSLTAFPQLTSVGAASTHASSLPHDEASQLHQIKPETSSKDEKLDQVSAPSDGNITVRDDDVLPPKIDNEQPRNLIFSPIGEIAWPSQIDGKANGGRTTKLPRPRNPLIDAVIANDQSKLRKVAERPRPQIEKVDERDSLLEQIRAKSFNLKPAVVSRPAIQGPTTNLRVAAILEKAKTIRQAFAGSDEDDDNDSWSDS